MQLSFSSGVVIVDTPGVVFSGCCNLWFGCCCCTPCFNFHDFLEIFARFLNFYSKDNWNRPATFLTCASIVPILSFKLLPHRNSDGVETSLVRMTSIGGKIFDKYCLLMLSPTRFAIPRKVKLSIQILMTLDT